MSIEVTSLAKSFGSSVAVEDVSFEVPAGSLMALLGPSGGGKSTVLRMIAGLEVPDAGTVRIDGEDVTRLPARSRGIGFCFQHYAPFRHMTAWENVAFGLKIRHRPKAEIAARVAELLELVRLSGFADRYPSQLSGGQRQRMALARALAVEPRVLLLDEPFGALDAQVRKELRTWLRELHEKVAVTTVLVTHDQEEAMEVADQIAVIREGRLEQVGTPAECYDHPASEFVLTFLGPATRINGAWVRPHDLALSLEDRPGARRGTVERIVRLGFETRVEVVLDDGTDTWVQLAGRALDELALSLGARVYVSMEHARDFSAVASSPTV
ncbi:MAG: sulfate transporter, ATPase subunit [Acidimicrobiaceae bacterium]|nr:sulfate transporter, ATPase subunit [Acidimicrobiaceae bacterium]